MLCDTLYKKKYTNVAVYFAQIDINRKQSWSHSILEYFQSSTASPLEGTNLSFESVQSLAKLSSKAPFLAEFLNAINFWWKTVFNLWSLLIQTRILPRYDRGSIYESTGWEDDWIRREIGKHIWKITKT